MNEHSKELVCLTGNDPDGQKICGVRLVLTDFIRF